MNDHNSASTVLTTAFEELTYALAGVVALHAVPNDAVWDMARTLDRVHRKALIRINAEYQPPHSGDEIGDQEHPAIVRLLRQLRDARGE